MKILRSMTPLTTMIPHPRITTPGRPMMVEALMTPGLRVVVVGATAGGAVVAAVAEAAAAVEKTARPSGH